MQRTILLLIATLPAFASTITNATISGLGTTTISGSATAAYFSGGFGPPDPSSISASAIANATTLGPVRSGFIEITGSGSGESGVGSGSVGGYSFGCSFSCSPANDLNGTPLPFTLGVPFQIDVSAFASAFGEGSGNISFQFSVFESILIPGFAPLPGASVAVFDPPDVPEPATFAPLGVGLLSLVAIQFARRGRRRREQAS
jgi:hypothetical protein